MLEGYTLQPADLQIQPGAKRGEEIVLIDAQGKETKGTVIHMRGLAGKLLALKPHEVRYWKGQPRKDRELTEEQKRDTSPQLQPGLVVAVETQRGIIFGVISGEQRARRAFLYKQPFNAAPTFAARNHQLFEAALDANLAVREMNPMETAEALREALHGMISSGLAKDRDGALRIYLPKSQKPLQYLKDRLSLLDLIPKLQQRVRVGSLKLGHALGILKKAGEDKAAQQKIEEQLARLGDGKVSARDLERILESDLSAAVPPVGREGAIRAASQRIAQGGIQARPVMGRPVVAVAPGRQKVAQFRGALQRTIGLAEELTRGISRNDGVSSAIRADQAGIAEAVDGATNKLGTLRKAIRNL